MDGWELLKQLSYDAAQETYVSPHYGEVELIKEDFKYVEEPIGKALLIGTSDIEMKSWREKFGGEPVGISLDVQWRDEAIMLQDVHDMEFNDNSFDFVYSSQTLEHSPAPIISLMQIARVLKDDGAFFFWIPFSWDNQIVKYHYSCFSPEIWIDLMRKAGLSPRAFCQKKNSFGYYGAKNI